jgi:ribosomal protein S18 acetylase RimI-like enzyme
MEFTTRIAGEEDKEFLYALNRAAYQDVVTRQFGTWDESWQRQYFEEKWTRAKYRIIEHDGQPIGAIWVTDSTGHRFVNEIQLLPEFQGQGIGSTLIREEMERSRDVHLPLRLQVLRQNPRARQLYTRLGFVVCGETATHLVMEYVDRD